MFATTDGCLNMDEGNPANTSHHTDAFVLDRYFYPRGRYELFAIRQPSSGHVFDCKFGKLMDRGNGDKRGPECLFIKHGPANSRFMFESFSNRGKYLSVNSDGRIQLGEAGIDAMFQLHDV
ncbi:uncharacterized protein [Diadema antillarum]|uniref:uncharacterized protein n=1 Tax=Diadema antillarum TaxID=105358 RepID=UPI003A83D9AC